MIWKEFCIWNVLLEIIKVDVIEGLLKVVADTSQQSSSIAIHSTVGSASKVGPAGVIGSAFDSRSKGYPFKSGAGQQLNF